MPNILSKDRHFMILGALAILILASGTSFADTTATPVNPGHPLSQTWIDTNMNLSSYNIYTTAGSAGIGISTPSQRLDVSGKIRISNDATAPGAGTMRYLAGNFEGYNGSSWNAFTGGGGAASQNLLQVLQQGSDAFTYAGITRISGVTINSGRAISATSAANDAVMGQTTGGNGAAIYGWSTGPNAYAGYFEGGKGVKIGSSSDFNATGNAYLASVSGNVGIGANPLYKLDVAGTARASDFIISNKVSCAGKLYTDASGNVLCGADQVGGSAGWSTAAGPIVYNNTPGVMVGIGTANPGAKLQVDVSALGSDMFRGLVTGDSKPRITFGSISATQPSAIKLGRSGVEDPEITLALDTASVSNPSILRVMNNRIGGVQNIVSIDAPYSDPKESTITLMRSNAGNDELVDVYNMNYGIGADSWGLNFIKNGAGAQFHPFVLSFQNGYGGPVTEAIRVLSDGKVGIGTLPEEILHIKKSSGYATVRIDSGAVQGQIFADSVGANVYAGTKSNHPFILETSNSEKMRIDTTGNVGIGTATPSEKLDVAGAIKIGDTTSTCDAAHRGAIKAVLAPAGECDSILACVKNSNDGYDWVEIKSCGNWLSGCPGIKVAAQDITTQQSWKVSMTACDTPQCSLDGAQDGDGLVSSNAIDFSLYPARDACKSIGGRLPTRAELLCISDNRGLFGTFKSDNYWTNAEQTIAAAYARNMQPFGGGFEIGIIKTTAAYVRCVK